MNKSVLLWSTVLVMLLLTSCEIGLVTGSGNDITEERELAVFDKIANFGFADIKILQGNTQLVTVTTDDNIINHVETTVSGNVLEIDMERGINYSGTSVKIEIIIPDLGRITNKGSGDIDIIDFESLNHLLINNSGSGDIDARSITAERFEIKNSGSGDFDWGDISVIRCIINNKGSGNLDIKGEVEDLDIENSGSGDLKYFNFESKICNITNKGSGDIRILCIDQLEVINKGSGNIFYKGDPSVHSSNSGSGKIVKID